MRRDLFGDHLNLILTLVFGFSNIAFSQIHPVLFSVRLVKISTQLILLSGGNPNHPNYCN